jgi:hypothetical protein
MIKITSITAIGILMLLISSPFIAIPRDWKNYVFIACGVAIIILSVLIRKELHKVLKVIHGDTPEIIKDTYVESNPQ